MAYATAGTPTDLNKQVNQLAQMARQSGDHMGFFQKYLTSSNPNRLAAQLAQGMVQQEVQGAETQKNLNQPQPPTVLDGLEQQQGMAAMPTERGMFNPDVYAQGGIGAGLGEEPQGQAQMARGGVVAFAGSEGSLVSPEESEKLNEWFKSRPQEARINYQEAEPYRTKINEFQGPKPPDVNAEDWEARKKEIIEGNKARDARIAASEASRPGPTQPAEPPAEPPAAPTKEQLKAEKQVTKLDDKIEKTVNKGKDPSKFIEERARLTEGINAGRTAAPAPAAPAPAAPAEGLTLETPAQAEARAAGINAGRPAPTVAAKGIAAGRGVPPSVQAVTAPAAGGVPPQAPPPGATAAPAAPGTPPPAAAVAGAEEVAASAAKPSLLQRGLGAIKTGASKLTGLGTPAGQMGVARTALNRAGVLGAAVGTGAYVGDELKGTSGARWLQSLVTPVSPEEHDANLLNNQVTSPETAKVVYDAAVQRESNGMQLYPKGHPKAGQPVTSSKGAIGVGQVMPETAKEAAQLAGLPWDEERYKNDRDYNYAIGQAYFYKQLDTFKGSVPSALAAYNAGPPVVQSYLTGKPLRLKDGTIINPDGIKTPYGIPPGKGYAETREYVKNIQGRIDRHLADKAKYAPEKPGVVRAGEMVQANLPEFMGGTGGPGGNAAQRFKEDLGDDPYRGASAAGVRDVLKAIPATISGVRDAFMGAPTPAPALKPTAQEQYADMLKNQAGQQAPAEAAPKDNKLFGYDRDRLGNIFLHSGAATLANPSQYALTSVGKGLQAGLTADEAREGKIAERAAKAEEGAKNRAEKQYEAGIAYQRTELSKKLPQLDQIDGANLLVAQVATLSGMSPQQRRYQGTDDATFKQLQRQAAAIMKQIQGGAPAAGDKGKPPSDNWGQIQKSGG